MNRSIAPDIVKISSIHTGFPSSNNSIYHIPSEDEVFRLEIIFPRSGYGLSENKYHSVYGLDLLLSGTNHMNSNDIATKIDGLGAYVFKSSDFYHSSITIYGTNENFNDIVSFIKECYESCIYPQDEINIFKDKKISELNLNLNKTSYLANRGINDLIFGKNHPYSEHLTTETIESLNSETLTKFKSLHLQNPIFIYTGNSKININEYLTKIGFETKSENFGSISDPVINSMDDRSLMVRKENSTQNSIRLGKIMPNRNDKDYFKISLLNLILGGYFGSRLMKNIREEKGLTYGIHSSITPFRDYSVFKISSECNKDLSEVVKEEILKEIETLRNHLISQEELETAKNYLSGHLLRSFDGAFNISERFRSALETGVEDPDNYYKNYFKEINAISAEQIIETANNYLDSNSLKLCIAGDI